MLSAKIKKTAYSYQITIQEYIFKKDYSRQDRSYWKCVKIECSARAITALLDPQLNELQVFNTEHNHVPNPLNGEWVDILMNLCKTHEMV